MKYLMDIPVDFVKIDKEFIQKAHSVPTAKIVLATLIELAQSIQARVTIEGVETKEQYDLVRDLGGDYCQGFYFSKPLQLQGFIQQTQYLAA
jgi:EAL domain-containing protein (putative c-di-GMP-specific phosphodiesterase class I)